MPKLGQGQCDFQSFNDVLKQAANSNTGLFRFAKANVDELRNLGHASAAERHNVSQTHAQTLIKVDVFDWMPAQQFAHLFLPCATVYVSSEEAKGMTQLCLPFLRIENHPNVANAITSFCSLTWVLAFVYESSLAGTARAQRIPHKMHIREEDHKLWFNESCSSCRIATAFRDRRKAMVYMYIGGGAVAHGQSYLLGGIVMNCKTWKWVVYANSAEKS